MEFNIISTMGLIVLVAYLFGGIVDSVCGGGGLITVPALMATGMPAHMVVGSNQCSMIFGAWTSFIEYAKAGKFNKKVGFIALPFALVGALVGSKLNLILDDRYLRIVMIALIPILAIFSFLKRNISDEDRSDEVSGDKIIVGAALIGFFVSVYHAFYGPASGVFFLVGFISVLKCDAVAANGIGRFILSCINLLTSVVYAMSGNVLWKLVPVATIGYMVGCYIGSKLAITKGAKIVRPLYYCVLTGLMIKLVLSIVS